MPEKSTEEDPPDLPTNPKVLNKKKNAGEHHRRSTKKATKPSIARLHDENVGTDSTENRSPSPAEPHNQGPSDRRLVVHAAIKSVAVRPSKSPSWLYTTAQKSSSTDGYVASPLNRGNPCVGVTVTRPAALESSNESNNDITLVDDWSDGANKEKPACAKLPEEQNFELTRELVPPSALKEFCVSHKKAQQTNSTAEPSVVEQQQPEATQVKNQSAILLKCSLTSSATTHEVSVSVDQREPKPITKQKKNRRNGEIKRRKQRQQHAKERPRTKIQRPIRQRLPQDGSMCSKAPSIETDVKETYLDEATSPSSALEGRQDTGVFPQAQNSVSLAEAVSECATVVPERGDGANIVVPIKLLSQSSYRHDTDGPICDTCSKGDINNVLPSRRPRSNSHVLFDHQADCSLLKKKLAKQSSLVKQQRTYSADGRTRRDTRLECPTHPLQKSVTSAAAFASSSGPTSRRAPGSVDQKRNDMAVPRASSATAAAGTVLPNVLPQTDSPAFLLAFGSAERRCPSGSASLDGSPNSSHILLTRIATSTTHGSLQSPRTTAVARPSRPQSVNAMAMSSSTLPAVTHVIDNAHRQRYMDIKAPRRPPVSPSAMSENHGPSLATCLQQASRKPSSQTIGYNTPNHEVASRRRDSSQSACQKLVITVPAPPLVASAEPGEPLERSQVSQPSEISTAQIQSGELGSAWRIQNRTPPTQTLDSCCVVTPRTLPLSQHSYSAKVLLPRTLSGETTSLSVDDATQAALPLHIHSNPPCPSSMQNVMIHEQQNQRCSKHLSQTIRSSPDVIPSSSTSPFLYSFSKDLQRHTSETDVGLDIARRQRPRASSPRHLHVLLENHNVPQHDENNSSQQRMSWVVPPRERCESTVSEPLPDEWLTASSSFDACKEENNSERTPMQTTPFPAPMSTSPSSSEETLRTLVGLVSLKGMKPLQPPHLTHVSHNQDRAFIQSLRPNITAFAVFDGHDQFQNLLMTEFRNTSTPVLQSEKNLLAWMRGLFRQVDKQLTRLHPESLDLRHSGTTGSLALRVNNAVYVGYVGDSKVVGYCFHGSTPIRVMETPEHSPIAAPELHRIQSTGARVSEIFFQHLNKTVSRIVEAGISVSRSFGDLDARLFGLICEPEFVKFEIEPQPKNYRQLLYPMILVLASDGLWDTLTAQEVLSFVNNEKRSKEAMAASSWRRRLESEGRSDDTTAILALVA